MSEQLIKQLVGHGGGVVKLMCIEGEYYVSKSGTNAGESASLLQKLAKVGFNTPKIYDIHPTYIEMEYIDGIDMQTFINTASTLQLTQLFEFIKQYFTFCLDNSQEESRLDQIDRKLEHLQTIGCFNLVNININNLYQQLPCAYPCNEVFHGDFTFDNIIYHDDQFYMIDCNPTSLNSIWFDGNKLRQDLDCLWFVRNYKNQSNYSVVCADLSERLKKTFDFLRNDSILIFMLMRILPYCTDKSTEEFLIREINKLCK